MEAITEPQNEIKSQLMFKGVAIKGGKRMSPLRGIVYGDNGVGKTTLLSTAKTPIIVDMEGNCGHIDAPKCRVTSLDDFNDLLNVLQTQDHNYKSLVIDSLDSLQTFLGESIGKKYSDKDLSYGKSAGIWAKHIKDLVAKLEALSNSKGMSILFTAHWKVKLANNPMTEGYDRYDMRINEEMRTGFCNWVQFIFLAMKDVILEDEKSVGFGKRKAKSIERRVLHTRGEPTYYGKNVFNLPAKMPMDWEQITTNILNFYNN
jgi:hypothetical protein